MLAGLVTAALTGVLCAGAVLKTNLFKELVLLHKRVKATPVQAKNNKED
jgi:hypothetical protein